MSAIPLKADIHQRGFARPLSAISGHRATRRHKIHAETFIRHGPGTDEREVTDGSRSTRNLRSIEGQRVSKSR